MGEALTRGTQLNSKEHVDPLYWAKHFEPSHIALLRIVRGYWGQHPPVSDLQLQFTAHYAGKHCLESVVLSRLANEAGAHAIAVGLLRHAVEALESLLFLSAPIPTRWLYFSDGTVRKSVKGIYGEFLKRMYGP